MKLLLDTHLLLWWLTDDKALPPASRTLIADPEHTVFVSAVTHWEIWLKQSLGKLRLPLHFEERLAQEPFESLPLMASHTREVSELPWHHRDPFDRMLIAQARVARMQFLTADEQARAYGDPVMLVA
jgi:PIN domain nuclease of toxin-antitoxin system